MKLKLATLAALLAATPAFADTTNGPDPYAAGFGFDTPTEASWGGWTRGDADTLYAEWDTFVDSSHGTSSDLTAAADVGSAGVSSAGTYTGWNSGTFKAGSGNLYNFGGDEFFDIVVAPAAAMSGPLTVALQFETWGNTLFPGMLLLNGNAPSSLVQTYTDPAYPSSFGDVQLIEYLAVWNLASAPTDFHFDLDTEVHTSFAQVAVDIAPVPEPEAWAMLLAGLGLVGWQARRRTQAAHTA
jgi:hypothetical protein